MERLSKSKSLKDRRGQTGGLITGLIFGVASLVIGVIIAFVIVSTLTGAGLLTGSRTTATTINETNSWVNETDYTLSNFNSATSVSSSIVEVWADGNQTNGTNSGILKTPTGYTLLVPAANYSLTASTGIIKNGTSYVYPNTSISYTINTESTEEAASDNLRLNFTEGVDNVSEQIPTVLLIAAIVLILAVLAILVGVWQRMRMGGGGSNVL